MYKYGKHILRCIYVYEKHLHMYIYIYICTLIKDIPSGAVNAGVPAVLLIISLSSSRNWFTYTNYTYIYEYVHVYI